MFCGYARSSIEDRALVEAEYSGQSEGLKVQNTDVAEDDEAEEMKAKAEDGLTVQFKEHKVTWLDCKRLPRNHSHY